MAYGPLGQCGKCDMPAVIGRGRTGDSAFRAYCFRHVPAAFNIPFSQYTSLLSVQIQQIEQFVIDIEKQAEMKSEINNLIMKINRDGWRIGDAV